MLADLSLALDAHGIPVSYHHSTNLHGALMEMINPDYANKLHQSGINPFSMCLLGTSALEWHVRTITDEAYEQIIMPLLNNSFTSFTIKNEINIDVTSKSLKTLDYKTLMNEFCDKACGNRFSMSFKTPVSFKVRNRYWNMPDIRLILQSLMKKYSAEGNENAIDKDTLDQLAEAFEPNRYNLSSTVFPMEGIVIPSFTGNLSFRIRGKETMARYVRLLLRFGEFSGIGIKCSIGMGAIQFQGGDNENGH